MTGPRYQNERMQELAERASAAESKLFRAQLEAKEYAEKLKRTPEEWETKITLARGERFDNIRLREELAETKTALADALHDAKRWRAIAGAPE